MSAEDSICPDLTAAARRLAAATGSGAACCIVTATNAGMSMQCGVGGTRQFVSISEQQRTVRADVQKKNQRDVDRCTKMVADIIEGDMEGTHGRCQPSWMSREQWVDFWKDIGPMSHIEGGVASRSSKMRREIRTHSGDARGDYGEWGA